MSQASEIKQAMKKKRLVMGWNSVERLVQSGKAKKVIVSVTASEEVKKDLAHYAEAYGLVVEEFAGDAYELGVICKKPFAVGVLAVKGD
jgi:ribosomal protein L30E